MKTASIIDIVRFEFISSVNFCISVFAAQATDQINLTHKNSFYGLLVFWIKFAFDLKGKSRNIRRYFMFLCGWSIITANIRIVFQIIKWYNFLGNNPTSVVLSSSSSSPADSFASIIYQQVFIKCRFCISLINSGLLISRHLQIIPFISILLKFMQMDGFWLKDSTLLRESQTLGINLSKDLGFSFKYQKGDDLMTRRWINGTFKRLSEWPKAKKYFSLSLRTFLKFSKNLLSYRIFNVAIPLIKRWWFIRVLFLSLVNIFSLHPRTTNCLYWTRTLVAACWIEKLQN